MEAVTGDAVRQAVAGLLRDVIKSIIEQPSAANKGATSIGQRLFFPNGVELIRFHFKLGAEIDVELVVAGKDAPKEPLGSFDTPDALGRS
jgi:hypothetical protein